MSEPVTPTTSWPKRLLIALGAFWAAMFYAMSFAIPENRDSVLAYGIAVVLSGGVALALFTGAVALAAKSTRALAIDACFALLGWAGVFLAAVMAGNVVWFRMIEPNSSLSREGMVLHMALLAVGNVALLVMFVRRMRSTGMPPPLLSALWFLVLNGAFLFGVRLLLKSGMLSL